MTDDEAAVIKLIEKLVHNLMTLDSSTGIILQLLSSPKIVEAEAISS